METRPVIYDPVGKPREVYSGVPSFLGLPVAENKEELQKYDFAVLGIPWEGGCTYGNFSSVVLGPKMIRLVSTRYSGYLPDYDIDSFDVLTGCDYGDTVVQNGNYDLSFDSIREKYNDLIEAGTIPIVLGGDHSIAYPTIQTLAKKHKKRVGVIHFDAHLDNYPAFGDDLYSRCSPFNRLYQDENMDPTKIVHIGIRGARNHPQERAEAKKYGATVITGKEIKETGYMTAIKKALEVAKKDTDVLYVTICSDVLDGASNPQGPIDPCGLTSFELAMMVNECAYQGACSFDFVEVYPEPGGAHISSHTAACIALYFLNGVARKKIDSK